MTPTTAEQNTDEQRQAVAAQTGQNPIVDAAGISKVFKDFWGRPKAYALQNVSFQVSPGQVFGLLGPNGSGKSTMVKLLLGLLYPTRGSLKILGASPRDVSTKQRIGYLPEESYLYSYLTAEETLDFFGSLFGYARQERRRRSGQLLEMVGLTGARNRPVGEFSKGMARRIGLAQALLNDPEVVVLDEPTSGLDPIGCREVKDIIRLLARRGKTVLLSSHLLADVEDVCDEVVVLYGGRIRAEGGLNEVLAVKDQTQITVPYLSPSALDRVLSAIREQVGSDEELQVQHPSMNLEEFFLNVVRQAKEESVSTSGVATGGRVAEYLQGDLASEETQEKNQLLQALTIGEEETTEGGVEAASPEDTEPSSGAEQETADKQQASERISKALGGEEDSQESSKEEQTEGVPSGQQEPSITEEDEEQRKEKSERLKKMLGDKDRE